MNKRLSDFTLRNIMIVYIIMYSIMPIVQRLTSRFLTAYFYMAVVVVLVVLMIVIDRPENLSMYGTFLLPFAVYGIMTAFYTSEDFFLWGFQTLLFLLPVILGYYFTQDTKRILPVYNRVIIICIIVTMLTTIIGCIQNPGASRILALVYSQDKDAIMYDMKNIGGYSFIYFLVLLYPILIVAYKSRRISLLLTLIIASLLLVTIVYSEYTTALLFFIISSFLFFTKRNLSARGIITIVIVSLLLLVVFSNVVVDFLNWLSKIVGSEDMSSRLDALANGREGLESSEDNRLELYQLSLNQFLKNPVFGTLFAKDRINGGHSFILDNLASFGLLGGVLMFFMYKSIFKRFLIPYKDKPGFGYIVWTFIQAIILSIINTGMWLDVLCLFTPILLHWIYGNETETKEVNDEAAVDSQLAPGASGGEAIRTTE